MLIEFSVANYRSFRDLVTLSMVAAKLKAKDPELDASNVFSVEGNPDLLTSAAIYGANASGKSNLISAIDFMRDFVLDSPKETRSVGAIDVDAFALSTETEGKPSHFEVVFIAEGTRYRYGFEVTEERVLSEWLFYVPSQRESLLFQRDIDEYYINSVFKEGKGIQERTRPNTLFLSAVAQWNGPTAQSIVTWFRRLGIASGLQDMGMRFYTIDRFVDGDDREAIVDLVRSLDLAIDNIKVEARAVPRKPFPEEMPEKMKDALRVLVEDQESVQLGVYTAHPKYDADGNRIGYVDFDMDERESEGTQKLFALAGPIVAALRQGQVLIIDEFDARLHSLMTAELVRRFNSTETNPHHAQLIFVTHDTNLLDNRLLRRDQIWFVEKDRLGASHLYSLVEFKIDNRSIRNDASYEKDYIQGRYGAIPYLGNFRQVFLEES